MIEFTCTVDALQLEIVLNSILGYSKKISSFLTIFKKFSRLQTYWVFIVRYLPSKRQKTFVRQKIHVREEYEKF